MKLQIKGPLKSGQQQSPCHYCPLVVERIIRSRKRPMYPLARCSAAPSPLTKVGESWRAFPSRENNPPHVVAASVTLTHAIPGSTRLTTNKPHSSSYFNFFTPSPSPSYLTTSSACLGGDLQSSTTNMAFESDAPQDDRIAKIASTIRVIPDFPKPGIIFQDITTLLLDPKAFKDTIDLFVQRYGGKGISVVAGIEARGFIFGPPIALAIGAKFVPLRKPGKLPGAVISEEYSLEYGSDKMEMHVGAVEAGERAIIIDDLIATGGTLCAAIKLLERVGAEVVECACVIELPELKGRERLGDKPLFVLIKS